MIIASLSIALVSIALSVYSIIVSRKTAKTWKKVFEIYGQSK